MKGLQLIFLAAVMAASISGTRSYAQVTNAPLALFTNGGGGVAPLTNGQLLVVGQTYHMVATPDAGYVFDNWQTVNVFTTTNFVIDTNGVTTPVVSTILSLIPPYTNQPSLDFVMQPVTVIYDNPGVRTITESRGWQADFAPITLNIELGDSAVVVTWTNSGFSLQAAPGLGGVYANVPGAVSPYTNNHSGQTRYFRLISN